jgi:hypothetical protein
MGEEGKNEAEIVGEMLPTESAKSYLVGKMLLLLYCALKNADIMTYVL